MTLAEFVQKAKTGRIFTVTFTKKNGETRVMNARLGVKRYLKGGELPYDPISKNLLPVYDVQKNGYRMINFDTVSKIVIDREVILERR